MKAPFDFVIEPKGNRYNNTTKVGDKDLILNTEVFNHQFVNREAIVKSVPIAFETVIQSGDTIITHHNVFRRWHDVKGIERNSKSYFDENEDDVRLFFFPTDGDERLECVNPVYFNGEEEKKKIDNLLGLAEKQFDLQKNISNE